MAVKTSSDLAGFLSVHSSAATLLSFSGSVHSVEGAARELGTDPTAAIKTLIFVSSEQGGCRDNSRPAPRRPAKNRGRRGL